MRSDFKPLLHTTIYLYGSQCPYGPTTCASQFLEITCRDLRGPLHPRAPLPTNAHEHACRGRCVPCFSLGWALEELFISPKTCFVFGGNSKCYYPMTNPWARVKSENYFHKTIIDRRRWVNPLVRAFTLALLEVIRHRVVCDGRQSSSKSSKKQQRLIAPMVI